MRPNGGDHGSVSLHHWREAHLQLGFGVSRPFHDVMGLLTPRDKVLVLVDVGHHVVHLLHGESAGVARVKRTRAAQIRTSRLITDMKLPQYPALGVLLPFVGEADEVSAGGKRRHCVAILQANHFG